MKVEFLGTGNALDTISSNCSYFVRGSKNIMIDCGFDIPRRVFEHGQVVENIDAFYLTHLHGDHSFGIPFLILALEKSGRTRPLPFIGQPGTRDFVETLLRMAYPSVVDRLKFDLNFIETTDTTSIGDMQLRFAKTAHGRSNYAVEITDGGAVVAFSGDGALSEESMELFKNCQLLVHDACTLEEPYETHESAVNVVNFAAQCCPSLKTVACVHLLEAERAKKKAFISLGSDKPFDVIVPEPGDCWPA